MTGGREQEQRGKEAGAGDEGGVKGDGGGARHEARMGAKDECVCG